MLTSVIMIAGAFANPNGVLWTDVERAGLCKPLLETTVGG